MKAFLDTNVIIDFYDERPLFFDAAAQIITKAYRGEIEIVVSATSFINAFYLLRKSYASEELTQAMRGLANLCTISDITKQMIVSSLSSSHPDFEDAVQMESAMSAQADVIITRDKRHFNDSKIPVLTPTDFLAKQTQTN